MAETVREQFFLRLKFKVNFWETPLKYVCKGGNFLTLIFYFI
jgi:hypothetical protein